MNIRRALIGIMAAGLLCFVGCSKNAQTPAPTVGGIDATALRTAFQDSPDEVNRAVSQILLKFRYHQYPEALAGLDELSSNAALTDPQKTAVTNAIE